MNSAVINNYSLLFLKNFTEGKKAKNHKIAKYLFRFTRTTQRKL